MRLAAPRRCSCSAPLIADDQSVAQLLGWLVVCAVGKTDRVQGFERAGTAVWRPRVDQWHLDVVQRGRTRDEVEALEDKTDLAVADGRKLVVVEPGDVGPVEEVASAGRHVQAADDVHQCRFARAAGAHDRDEVAAFDMQVNSAERLDLDPAHAVGLGARLQPDHPPPPMRTPPPLKRFVPPLPETLSVGITTSAPSLRPPVISVNWSPTTPVSIAVWTSLPPTYTLT